jgi:pimeloyl-ACP methyl ester carboxylesterase
MAAYAPALPNIPLPTLGGKQFWADRYLNAGWRIQENVFTGHARLLDPDNIRRCWGGFEACRAEFERIRDARGIAPYSGHLVILVPGLGRSRASMGGLQAALREAGYQVAGIDYPSTRRGLARNADSFQDLIENLEGVDRVSFVTHSLGGLLVRELLSREADWRGRIEVNAVVMIAPPSRGAAIADILRWTPPVNLIMGRGLIEATTQEARTLPAPDAPFGIIAFGRGGMGYNPFLRGDNDLLVSVDETRLDGAADWVQLHGLHGFAPNYPETAAAVMSFLENKRFSAASRMDP